MESAPFEYTRLEGGKKHYSTSLGGAMGVKDVSKETWLFVSPHDDDACIGGGLWIQAALAAKVKVCLLVVTDGRMGYCQPMPRQEVVETRRVETYESCEKLGLDGSCVKYIDYPDGGLFSLQGRLAAEERPEIDDIRGFVGLQNAMTYHLRAMRPARVFVPTPTDLHPDHQVTYRELMISLFHASGAVWPELGAAIERVPRVYEMAVYCDFSGPPNLQLLANQEAFDRKLQSIAAFRSQEQIAKLVENVRGGGPYEYLREVAFHLYTPGDYRGLFGSAGEEG